MTQDEIDTMWQKAMHQSIKEGEMFTRYQFAKLVADKATEEANAKANASWTLMCKKMVAIEREALAQPEQKHPLQVKADRDKAWAMRETNCGCDHNEFCDTCWPVEFRKGGYWDQQEALAQHDSVQAKPEPEQEPVAWMCKRDDGHFDVLTDQTCKKCFPVYTTPPQRQPLTDEEIDFHLDKILRASGTALKNYSMQKTKDDMRQALREAFV